MDVFCDTCENDSVNNVTDNVTLHGNSINATHNCNMTTDDSELLEDQITLEQKENLTGHVLPSMLQFENIENAIFQCVPAQNNIPRYVLLDDEFEVLYIFCAQHMIDLQHIQSEINLVIRLSRGRTLNGREITASTL